MLRVRDLSVTFTRYDRGLEQKKLTVITHLDLEAGTGEIVAVIGSSGSGKSLLAHAILGILPANASISGNIFFKNEALTPMRQQALRGREIALIPQSLNYLDPLQRVGAQVRRAACLSGLSHKEAEAAQKQAFKRYGLSKEVEKLFPFQISGGMARRVLMASATIGRADLLIADEPTPGLHPEILSETLGHLRELADEGKGIIFITHDMEAAFQIADRVAVFYAGMTLEESPVSDFSGKGENLRHPYSQALWRAVPQNDFTTIPGTQPLSDNLPEGCLFASRCPVATQECFHEIPPKQEIQKGFIRCIHAQI